MGGIIIKDLLLSYTNYATNMCIINTKAVLKNYQ